MVGLCARAQTWTGEAGKVYIKNVGAGLYWGAGNNWGTRASLVREQQYVTLAGSNGTFTMESMVSNGGTNYYFNGDYMDNASATSLTFTEVETGIYTIGNGTSLYGYDGSSTVLGKGLSDASSDNARWQIYTQADIDAMNDAALASATLDSPVDASFLIIDAGFGRNRRDVNAWTMVASNQNLGGGPNETNYYSCAESYRSEFTLTQVINDVPNGVYELTAQGFYRQDGSDNEHLPVFYINGTTGTFPARTGSENSMTDAANTFAANEANYRIEPIRVTVGDGKITLGAKLEGNTMLWCIWSNFKLKYYGIDLSAYATEISNLRTTLTALVEEPMKASVLATANTALTETASVAQNQTAMEAAISQLNTAISAAQASIAAYAEAKTYLDACNSLDAAGRASYAANATVVAVQEAYDDASLEALTAEQKTAMDAAIIVAAKAQTTEGADLTLSLINPSFENDFTGWTNNSMARQNNASFEKDGTWYCEYWQPNGTFGVTQSYTIPNSGVYRLSAKSKARGVTSAKLFAGGVDKAIIVGDNTDTYSVEFAADADAEITFGFEGTGTGAGNSWLCVDDFTLTYVGALPDVEAVEGKMKADVAAAQTSAIEAYNANKTVANYNAAVSAINAAETSKAAYAAAATAIANAKAVKDAHNFASETATTTFAEAIAAIETPYNEGTLSNDDANAASSTLGLTVTGWHAGNNSPAVVYLRDGFALGDFAADPALHVNTWSTEGDGDGTGFSVPFYETWTGSASLPEETAAGTLSGLPNGLYSVTVWVRKSAASDAEGITMDVNGGSAVAIVGGDKVGNFYLKEYTAEGLVKRGTLTLTFNVAGETGISWLSFKNVKYTKLRDLTEEEAFIEATAEDYAALNAAIDAHVLGFEAGEYAPYNNIEAAAALATAKAIDQTARNSQGNYSVIARLSFLQ